MLTAGSCPPGWAMSSLRTGTTSESAADSNLPPWCLRWANRGCCLHRTETNTPDRSSKLSSTCFAVSGMYLPPAIPGRPQLLLQSPDQTRPLLRLPLLWLVEVARCFPHNCLVPCVCLCWSYCPLPHLAVKTWVDNVSM